MPSMDSREITVCEAAARMFMRYGVKRTSVNDIAQEAGVARQTLYNMFSSKDEILESTIRLVLDRELSEASYKIKHLSEISDQLSVIFEHLATRPYAMLHATPNAQDILEGVGNGSRKVIGAWRAQFRDLLISVLIAREDKLNMTDTTAVELADAIASFASSSKREARDAKHLGELLQTLKTMVLRCVE